MDPFKLIPGRLELYADDMHAWKSASIILAGGFETVGLQLASGR